MKPKQLSLFDSPQRVMKPCQHEVRDGRGTREQFIGALQASAYGCLECNHAAIERYLCWFALYGNPRPTRKYPGMSFGPCRHSPPCPKPDQCIRPTPEVRAEMHAMLPPHRCGAMAS